MAGKSESIREDIKKAGYSREEEYFYTINRELIEKRRQQIDQERREQRGRLGTSDYWMRCPKCGEPLEETNLMGICVDKCSKCQGVYIDQAEAETLIEARQSHLFLNRLKKLFKPPDEADLLP